jgi:NADH pyrophosphatase NudC (nudix superfamily)
MTLHEKALGTMKAVEAANRAYIDAMEGSAEEARAKEVLDAAQRDHAAACAAVRAAIQASEDGMHCSACGDNVPCSRTPRGMLCPDCRANR